MFPTYPFSLAIERLAVPVFLGVGEEERQNKQEIFLSIKIGYSEKPKEINEDMGEYVCYDTLCQKLLAVAAQKPYHLIEYLSSELMKAVRNHVPAHADVWLKLQKPLPVSLVGYQIEGAAVELFDAGVKVKL